VCGIQDPAIEMGHLLFSSIEEMASFYIKKIKEQQKTGPYLLGGASFGATMAFEMTRQLRQQKEEVQFLAILDGWAFYPKKILEKAFLEKYMWQQYKNIRKHFRGSKLQFIKPIIDIHLQRNYLLSKYKYHKIDTQVYLFKAEEIMEVFRPIDAKDNHWSNYVENLRILTVSGNHETMFYKPYVESLARQIEQSFNELYNRLKLGENHESI